MTRSLIAETKLFCCRSVTFAGGSFVEVILTTACYVPPRKLKTHADACLSVKKRVSSPDCGCVPRFSLSLLSCLMLSSHHRFDLVGPGDLLRPLRYYLEPLHRSMRLQGGAGVEVLFIFCAGEIVGDGTTTTADATLHDAILLPTERIGHG